MRFSSAIVLVAIAALAASPISAMPTDAAASGTDICPNFCHTDEVCKDCTAVRECFLHSESCFCFHIGTVWPLALTHELLVICKVDQRTVRKTPVELA
ncbi:hypothetical protein F4604DRAFT_1749991 [Suillus subluteus]|nr:hypothetical protein F4604DRAFT_1749991 [Suillus subluteus]